MNNQIKFHVGDLFSLLPRDRKVYLPHVCNDKGGWGAGFVIPLGKIYPQAKIDYKENFKQGLGRNIYTKIDDNLTIVNMIAQTLGGPRPLYYNHLAMCMDLLAFYAQDKSPDPFEIWTIPFGAGLGGGDWNFIQELMNDCWLRLDIPVNVCVLPHESHLFLPLENVLITNPIVGMGGEIDK